MRAILLLFAIAALGFVLFEDPPLVAQVKIHIEAIRRHAVEVAAEQAAEISKRNNSSQVYAAVDIIDSTGDGITSIPKGSPVHIISMSGDQLTITNGRNIITTTPDAITNIEPAMDPAPPNTTPLPNPQSSPPPLVEPPPPPPLTPEQVQIQARVTAIEQQINELQQKIDESQMRDQLARQRGSSSAHTARTRRYVIELDRLIAQRTNLLRQLR